MRSTSILFVLCCVLTLVPAAAAQVPPEEGTEGEPSTMQQDPPAEEEAPTEDLPEPVAPPPMVGAAKPEYEPLVMEYVGGEECVAMSDDVLTINRGNVRPNKVWWLVTDTDHYWELRYDNSGTGGKVPGMGDFFSSATPGQLMDIECGEVGLKSRMPQNVGYRASWPYKVIVYECENGQKGVELCREDPRIDWGN